MPRRARLSLPGVPWHIIQRGNNRSVCFFAEQDYRFYLERLQELAARFECAVHAYVLMTNHVHLLLTPVEAGSASLLMKHLGQSYVQHINRVKGRSGTLWEGRYRSCLTQTEDYVLACYRYIELNPVRAGLVNHPRDYRWSSYGANAIGKVDALVTPHEQYLRIARSDVARRDGYRALFKAPLEAEMLDDIRQSTNGNFALGGDRFKKQIEKALGQRAQRGKPGRPRQVEVASGTKKDSR